MPRTPMLGTGVYGLVNETALASVERLDRELAEARVELAEARVERDALCAEIDRTSEYARSLILSRRNRTAGAFITGAAVGVLIAVGMVLS